MRIIFDHNVPRPLRRHLSDHVVTTTAEMNWEDFANGKLLRAAADAGFECFLTMDKKIEHEQNLRMLPLPVVLIDVHSTALPQLLPFVPQLLALLGTPLDPALYIIAEAGQIDRLTAPRTPW